MESNLKLRQQPFISKYIFVYIKIYDYKFNIKTVREQDKSRFKKKNTVKLRYSKRGNGIFFIFEATFIYKYLI